MRAVTFALGLICGAVVAYLIGLLMLATPEAVIDDPPPLFI